MAIDMAASKLGPPTEELIEGSLVLMFDDLEDSDPTYIEWLEKRGMSIASDFAIPTFVRTRRRNAETRLPDEREARSLTLALLAVNGFLKGYRRRLTSRVAAPAIAAEISVQLGEQQRSVPVRWAGEA